MKLFSFLLSLLMMFIFTKPAYAYLDPGTGSMLLQGLIAVFMVVITTAGIYWNRLKSFLGRFMGRSRNKSE